MNDLENVINTLSAYKNHSFGNKAEKVTVDDIIKLLKAQECATVEPKRDELSNETKAWLDKMDVAKMLDNIVDICIDWDGYRTANGLGSLINEIWAYARYGADKLMKAQEPRLVTEADFENADEYGFIPAWCEETNKLCYWNCILRTALETTKEDGCRYWTTKPSLKQMEETPWN